MSSAAAPAPALLGLPDTRSFETLASRPAPPPGHWVRLPGHGRIFVRERPGPAGAPTVVLLHGWIASGGLNWLYAFGPLSRHFRVLAPDLHGHGHGHRSLRGRFELDACANDVAAMLRALDAGPAIVAGYSLGGPVAQLLWRQHRDEVAGLVLCATSPTPVPDVARSGMANVMKRAAGAGRIVDWSTWGTRRMTGMVAPRSPRAAHLSGWVRREFGRHHWPTVIDAGRALACHDASRWIDRVDVPTSVVLTKRDSAVPPADQREMAQRIPDARIHSIDAGHLACMQPDFGATMVEACRSVARRI